MNKFIKLLWIALCIFFISAFLQNSFAATEKNVVLSSAPYIPGLGEIMNNDIQPHHIKMGLAGKSGNWSLAAYELNELKEAFNTVVQYQANWDNKPIAKMQSAFMDSNFKSINAAIKSKDVKKFVAAYTKLTNACNACHQANDHAFIVIKVPTSSSFPNQEFKSISTK